MLCSLALGQYACSWHQVLCAWYTKVVCLQQACSCQQCTHIMVAALLLYAAHAAVLKGVLDLHNQYRARHGAPALTWSSSIASTAQSYSRGCVMQHSHNQYGENLAKVCCADTDQRVGQYACSLGLSVTQRKFACSRCAEHVCIHSTKPLTCRMVARYSASSHSIVSGAVVRAKPCPP